MGEVVVPGRGDPVRDGVVVLDGATIAYAGPALTAPDTPGATVTRAAAVLPGLWDCHTHLVGLRALDLGGYPWNRSRCGPRGPPLTCARRWTPG